MYAIPKTATGHSIWACGCAVPLWFSRRETALLPLGCASGILAKCVGGTGPLWKQEKEGQVLCLLYILPRLDIFQGWSFLVLLCLWCCW